MVTKADVLGLMDDAECVFLATISEKGPRLRALVNLRRKDRYAGPSRTARTEDFTAYLSTSAGSDKVREVRADPRVALYYCEAKTFHGVMLAGRAEMLDDPELKKALWSDDWRLYWPEGPDHPDYVVIRLKAEEVSGWWGSQEFSLPPEGA